jgi:hypothetical protein
MSSDWIPAFAGMTGFYRSSPENSIAAGTTHGSSARTGTIRTYGIQKMDSTRRIPRHPGTMDEIVKRAMQKWPSVPNVFGWLRLDLRGNWLVKSRATRDGQPVFERITNAAVIEFIGRNYQPDERGRWFFQNGPQRVFVTLDLTPLVFRLIGAAGGLETHTGVTPNELRGAWLDDAGHLVIASDLGPGVLLDRDLHAIEARLGDAAGAPLDEARLEALLAGRSGDGAAYLDIGGARLAVAHIASAALPARFGFDPAPRPAPGEPDC